MLVYCLNDSLVNYLDVSLYSNYQQVWSLLLVLSLSCVIILDFCLSTNN